MTVYIIELKFSVLDLKVSLKRNVSRISYLGPGFYCQKSGYFPTFWHINFYISLNEKQDPKTCFPPSESLGYVLKI